MQASVHWCKVLICHSATMTDGEEPEGRSSSTILRLPKEAFGRSGYFVQTALLYHLPTIVKSSEYSCVSKTALI